MSVDVPPSESRSPPSESDHGAQHTTITSTTTSRHVVQSLFGADFGPCWGDFFCSHGRIRGRLYVVTNGILFFSSLLGFERRLCLQFSDISALALHRTTSIRIDIADYDTYIFRSFQDREKVLHLLIRLKLLVEKNRTGANAMFDTTNTTLERSKYRDTDNFVNYEIQQMEHESGTRSFGCSPQSSLSFPALHASFSSSNIDRSSENTSPLPNRRRAVSDSGVHSIKETTSSSMVESENRDGTSVQSSVSTLQEVWEEATQILASKKEIGIDCLRLGCSLDEFYHLFLSDDASYSYDRYQKENIHDRDVSVTKWSNDDMKHLASDQINIQSRVLKFTHPIKNAVGFGPSEARTTRRQLLRRYQNFGITIENKTIVEGIPAADTFSVDDFWHIRSDGADNNNVILSVNFEINFTKRSMFKTIIEKSVLRETRTWLLGYSKMAQEALTNVTSPSGTVASKHFPESTSMDTAGSVVKHTSRMPILVVVTVGLLVTACLIAVIVYAYMLYKLVANINDELMALRVLHMKIIPQLGNK